MTVIEYVDGAEGLTEEAIAGFCSEWAVPPPGAALLAAIQGSSVVAWARHADHPHPVGLIAAITDGALSAHISLLEVLPGWRGRGIGTGLVRRCLDRLCGLYAVDLTCDPQTTAFYARFGLRPGTAMLLRNRQALGAGGGELP